MINISEKIASLRKAHNLTQEALGEAVGVSAQAVSKWEKGDSLPDISVIPDICRTFGISADTLIGSEGNMTADMYIEKALEVCKGLDEKLRLIHIFMMNGSKEIGEMTNLGFHLSEAENFLVTDGRGFGMYFHNIEYIKNMMSVDLVKSELLKLMSDEKVLKIFSLISINGRLNENEVIKLTGFSQQEITERLFTLMKWSLIQSVMGEIGNTREMAYSVAPHGIFFIGIMANVYLFEPTGRTGIQRTSMYNSSNPDKLRKFMD
ncbi:MAG: helix-turn-helix domain-containing protein [Oscillospiraceae bacterium]|nr:helix-turn-helix domain-containing protein [Oscillospiraceae bacterium]